MILTVATTYSPATDLGYLLHKNPARVHQVELNFGRALLVYPEATAERCEAMIALDVDSVTLARGKDRGRWSDYVSDRPYAASSFLSSAISKLLGTAMTGRSKERPELADSPIPLEFRLPVVRCRGGESFLRRVFEPLGYVVEATVLTAGEDAPDYERVAYFDVRLSITTRLAIALNQLAVLIPVLDDDKHYWVNADEIDKLMRRGEAWLQTHPDREEITRRYLQHQRNLTRMALERLAEADGDTDPDATMDEQEEKETALERPLSLHTIRLERVAEEVRRLGAKRVLDLGCGEGRLIQLLLKQPEIEHILGVDVALHELQKAARRLRLDEASDKKRARLTLVHGSLLYRDHAWSGYDVATLVEVIEHLDPPRLRAMERVVFEYAAPDYVIVTTPNREYNAKFPTLAEGRMRHGDHRFEWNREEFSAWAARVRDLYGYSFMLSPLGEEDADLGAPSQMAVFSR